MAHDTPSVFLSLLAGPREKGSLGCMWARKSKKHNIMEMVIFRAVFLLDWMNGWRFSTNSSASYRRAKVQVTSLGIVRASRFSQSCVLPRSFPAVPSSSFLPPSFLLPQLRHCQASTASSTSRGRCRTSTARSGFQWALPGNHKRQISVTTPQLKSGARSAHWDLVLAVEVRQCPCQREC